MLPGQAEQLPAEGLSAVIDRLGCSPGRYDGPPAIRARRNALQIANDALAGRFGDGDAGQFGALERHQLPAQLAGVAGVAGLVSPAAALGSWARTV